MPGTSNAKGKQVTAMKNHLDSKSVGDLLELRTADMLYANREYQRGPVWSTAQKKSLVDSVLRGYPIPLIYLHHISKDVAGHRLDKFEVIDGQQRINAIRIPGRKFQVIRSANPGRCR